MPDQDRLSERGWPTAGALAAAAVAAGLVVALGFSEGGYFESAWPPATIALAAVAALAVVLGGGVAGSFADVAFVAGLACLAAWQAASAAWSVDAESSLREAERGLLYVAAALALVAVGRRGHGPWLLAGVLAGGGCVSGYSLARRAIGGSEDTPFQAELLNRPLGYANALGLLAALALVIAVGLALSLRPAIGLALVAAAAPVAAATLVLTSSRGSVLAAALGLGTVAVFRGTMSKAARSACLGAQALLVAAVLASPLAIDLVALERRLSGRPYYWWTAWHALPDHPVLGWGAGTFHFVWAAGAPISISVRDAHTLYLEALVELGPLGLALVLLALVVPAAVAVATPTPAVAAAAGAYAAFLVHAGFDWDWEMPAVTVAGLASGAALLAEAPRRPYAAGSRVFGAAALLILIAVGSLVRGS